MGKIKARGQFHQIKNEDTGASSIDSQDYTDHTVGSLGKYTLNLSLKKINKGRLLSRILYTV